MNILIFYQDDVCECLNETLITRYLLNSSKWINELLFVHGQMREQRPVEWGEWWWGSCLNTVIDFYLTWWETDMDDAHGQTENSVRSVNFLLNHSLQRGGNIFFTWVDKVLNVKVGGATFSVIGMKGIKAFTLFLFKNFTSKQPELSFRLRFMQVEFKK